jgi:hypothetical protein
MPEGNADRAQGLGHRLREMVRRRLYLCFLFQSDVLPKSAFAFASRYPKALALGLSLSKENGALAPGVCLPSPNPNSVILSEGSRSLIARAAVEGPASALLFCLSFPKGICVCSCSCPEPPKTLVISTEAAHSLIVSSAVERSPHFALSSQSFRILSAVKGEGVCRRRCTCCCFRSCLSF